MISVYADGSSSGRIRGPGGYGFVIVRDGDEVLAWSYGGSPVTTNNLMEIQGVIAGLSVAIEMGLHEGDIEVVSDSQYTLGIGNGSYSPTKNLEEAARLRALVRQAGAATRWVRGHAGERWNEVCDELAKQGKIEHTPASVLAKQARKKRKGKSASTETGFDKYLAGRLADPVFAAEYQAAYRELAQQEVAAAATPTPDTAD